FVGVVWAIEGLLMRGRMVVGHFQHSTTGGPLASNRLRSGSQSSTVGIARSHPSGGGAMHTRVSKGFYFQRGKRLLDLALTLPAVLVLAPIMVIVALLVRYKLGSPVLFRQQRLGLHDQTFT